MRKDQCDAHVAADVAKAAVVKGGDLQRAGKCRGCCRRGCQLGQNPSPVTGETSLSHIRTLEMLEDGGRGSLWPTFTVHIES